MPAPGSAAGASGPTASAPTAAPTGAPIMAEVRASGPWLWVLDMGHRLHVLDRADGREVAAPDSAVTPARPFVAPRPMIPSGWCSARSKGTWSWRGSDEGCQGDSDATNGSIDDVSGALPLFLVIARCPPVFGWGRPGLTGAASPWPPPARLPRTLTTRCCGLVLDDHASAASVLRAHLAFGGGGAAADAPPVAGGRLVSPGTMGLRPPPATAGPGRA